MKNSNNLSNNKSLTRRTAIKSGAVGASILVAAQSNQEIWSKPTINSVILPAHALTSACPEFLESDNWYETAPDTTLSSFSQIRLVITLRNDTSDNFEVDGTFQLWTQPSVINDDSMPPLPVTVNSASMGTFTPGSTFTYDLTVDTSGLPNTETGFGFRGRDTNLFGNIRPSIASIVSTSSTCSI